MEDLVNKNYKEKYDKALEWAKELCNSNNANLNLKVTLKDIFPELKENEDENIRKAVKEAVEYYWSDDTQARTDILSWLEKQGEPVMYDRDNYNSAKEKAWNCKSFDDDSNRKSIFMKGFQDGYQFGIHEEKPHRWTRHDEAVRKEAVECLVDWKNKFPSIYSCDYRNVLNWLKEELSIHAEEKQDEQKPAWSEKHIADVFEKVGLARIVREQGNDQLTNAVQSAMIELSKQKKPTWSEEDKKKIDLLIAIFEVNHPNEYFKVNPINTLNMEAMSTEEIVDWLKSLKERMKGE